MKADKCFLINKGKSIYLFNSYFHNLHNPIIPTPVLHFNFKLFTTQSGLLMTLKKKPFKDIVRKGENAVEQHFLLFPQCFLPIPGRVSVF